MGKQIKGVLVTRDEISRFVNKLANEISNDYQGNEIVIIGILKGSFIFLADLVRQITIPVRIDFMSVSSYYGSTKSSGIVKIIKDLDVNIAGRHVLIVEDIVDSGTTLQHLKDLLLTREPASLRICTALDKPAGRKTHVDVDYIGMEIPDEFIVGYGLDFDEQYRNLPDICILADEGGRE